MPNSLGVEELEMPQKVGHVGHQGRREGERKRGHGKSPKVGVGCWLDALGTLGEVPLNRHKD